MYLYMKKAQESRNHAVGPSQLIRKFEITFERSKERSDTAGFFPGDPFEGHVTFELHTWPQPIGLKLQLIGAERVNWLDGKQHSSKRFLATDISTKPVRGVDGKFKFKLNLPFKLPQSYNGKQGSIHYWLEPVFGEGILTAISASTRHEGKMTVKQRNEFLKKYRKPIKIQAHFDLSIYPLLHHPISVMKDNSGMFTSKNLIEVILALPKLGYVPNENIEFQMHIINGSDKAVTSSAITLFQEAKFSAGPVNTQERKKLFQSVGPQVATKNCQVWNSSIQIPSKVSPISIRCSFISVDYYLQASVRSTGFMDTVTAKIPIVIGTLSTTGVKIKENPETNNRPPVSLSSSMESIVSQVTYCSHGYMERSCCDDAEKLPNYASVAAALASELKMDDNWETMSFSSLPCYDDACSVAGGSGTSVGGATSR